jgi:hypothetical protein
MDRGTHQRLAGKLPTLGRALRPLANDLWRVLSHRLLHDRLTEGCAIASSGNANNQGSNPIPDDFLINYAGSGTVQVSGNGAIYTVINAPNAGLSFTGNGAIYGAAIGSTISYTGNAAFHFDRSIQLQSSAQAGYYNRIGYRELPY